MLLRLSPIPVRPLGHAVHRAPDTERDEHPGYGAAGHTVWYARYGYRCSVRKVCFTRDTRVLSSKLVPYSDLPGSVRSSAVCGPSVQVPWLSGSDLSGHGLVSAGGGRSKRERDDPTQHVREGRQTNVLRNKDGYAYFGS